MEPGFCLCLIVHIYLSIDCAMTISKLVRYHCDSGEYKVVYCVLYDIVLVGPSIFVQPRTSESSCKGIPD